MGGVFGDDVLRKRPGAVGMRIVRAPHNVAVAEKLDQVQSDEVSLKGRPYLALEDFTRHGFERNLRGFPALELPLVAVIHFLHDEGNPSDGGFGEAELELGMALQG